MAGPCSLASILVAQSIISLASTVPVYLNRKYFIPPHPYRVYENPQRFVDQHRHYRGDGNFNYASKPEQNHQWRPFIPENHTRSKDLLGTEQNAERKVVIYKNPKYKIRNVTNILSSEKTLGFENFVTPKGDTLPRHSYEVTTKRFEDSKPPETSALGHDSDLTIAIDDEDVDLDASDRPAQNVDPLVHVDSYGLLHGQEEDESGEDNSVEHGRAHHGHGFGYGVVHAPAHHRGHRYKQTTGRVRMQVFRGPTRTVGHKKYAPWGYYVVQPADPLPTHHQSYWSPHH